MVIELRPYQEDILCAVLRSAFGGKGLTFCVEIARQGGKNELSASIEEQLLSYYADSPLSLVKCSPTFKPQALISFRRLKDRLGGRSLPDLFETEMGYIIRLGQARAVFLSADGSSSVVGHTADLLLEVDEAQDVGKEKYSREFRPMGATSNVTTVLYGTTWDDTTLLEETRQHCLELERRDGIKRCFRYDWEEVARYSPAYRAYVESERQRLGEDHPLFRTQYRLLPVRGGGGFLSLQQRAQLQGEHSRRHAPGSGTIYVAGLDLAGEAESDSYSDLARPASTEPLGEREFVEGRPLSSYAQSAFRQDATVLTIGELEFPPRNHDLGPVLRVVEHYSWRGIKHAELYPRLVNILKHWWRCRRVVVDSTGVGQPVYSFLKRAVGGAVTPLTFTARSKSELGFNLLATVDSGSLKMYRGDGSAEYQEFWSEMERAKSYYRASRTMNFFVEPSQGHDDYLMSLALLVEAARSYRPRVGRGV